MNIFVTDKCPVKCAEYLDNKRVVKMVLETTQMLCTAINELHGKQLTPYKSTHKNHPCNVWVRKSYRNWCWLLRHGFALSEEYTKRYGKTHKCLQVLSFLKQNAFLLRRLFKEKQVLTPFNNSARNKALGIDYTVEFNVFTAYQKYLNDRWDNDKLEPKWQ